MRHPTTKETTTFGRMRDTVNELLAEDPETAREAIFAALLADHGDNPAAAECIEYQNVFESLTDE